MEHKKEVYRKATKYNPATYKYRGFIISSHYDCGRSHWSGYCVNSTQKFGGWSHTIKDVQEKIDNYLEKEGK